MSTMKKCQVVMLPTKEKAPLMIEESKLYFAKEYGFAEFDHKKNFAHTNKQHLYILSDEEIREGDWWMNTVNNEIQKSKKIDCWKDYVVKREYAKKIIASTDTKLVVGKDRFPWTLENKYLPQPSQEFLEIFVKEYNKGNGIKEVMVEYVVDKYDERNQYQDVPSGKYWEDEPRPKSPNNLYTDAKYFIPKTNPKDNTITIKRVKDS